MVKFPFLLFSISLELLLSFTNETTLHGFSDYNCVCVNYLNYPT